MIDFDTAQTEIDRLVSLLPQSPRVFLIKESGTTEGLPPYLIDKLKISSSYIKQSEKSNLRVNGIYFDETPLELAAKPQELLDDASVVLFLENIADIGELREAFMHEVVGHYAVARTMAQRMRENKDAQDYIKNGISEYNLFHDHVLSEERKRVMRKTYSIPSSFIARFKYASRTRRENGGSSNPLMSMITAKFLKNDFDSLVASEIIAHSVNSFLLTHSIEDAIKLGEIEKSKHGSSLWSYTNGDMTELNQPGLRDEGVIHELIFAWMLCPAMNWLITPKSE